METDIKLAAKLEALQVAFLTLARMQPEHIRLAFDLAYRENIETISEASLGFPISDEQIAHMHRFSEAIRLGVLE
ncbi:hypothetical protein [Ralstonia mannitolilytica]|uniref:hypothetical protein n=1 Tax=Ralstonia mannitolilytica TaxID=105219 RepID=UPI000C7E6F19|nr:hypothetical protein [Ralstonia mannitolilytica]PLT18714.1 hypothetical protein CXP34_01535 [Ralstonia mannitolilytica]